jgi:hypothetical protein
MGINYSDMSDEHCRDNGQDSLCKAESHDGLPKRLTRFLLASI